MRPSKLIAVAAFVALVPATLAAAYAGSSVGLYGHSAIPVVFGLLFAAGLVAVFALIPVVRRWID